MTMGWKIFLLHLCLLPLSQFDAMGNKFIGLTEASELVTPMVRNSE
jgi:hypothetical protein